MEIKTADQILKKHIGETMSYKSILDAMKEYAKQFIDLAVEEARFDVSGILTNNQYKEKGLLYEKGIGNTIVERHVKINKESILKVKQLIK